MGVVQMTEALSAALSSQADSPDEKESHDAWILLSGGLDSTVCVDFYLGQDYRVTGLFVDFGQPAAPREQAAARSIADHYGIPLRCLKWKGHRRYSDGEIIGRNAFLAFAALTECGACGGLLAFGIHSSVPYFDCTPSFVADLQRLFDGYTSGTVRVACPFLTWSKAEIWEHALSHGVPIHLTYSCERGTEPVCGSCRSCRDMEPLHAR